MLPKFLGKSKGILRDRHRGRFKGGTRSVTGHSNAMAIAVNSMSVTVTVLDSIRDCRRGSWGRGAYDTAS